VLPCLIFEDEHLLVMNKPAGLNTHSPSAYAGEGLYDWLRHREPRWSKLAIIQRLDKETSGVMVFSKTTAANRSLTQQFAARSVRKTYVLLTDQPVPQKEFTAKSCLTRAGERYVNRPLHAVGDVAETHFRLLPPSEAQDLAPNGVGGCAALEAEPLTGRTHQIRVHAAAQGFPILGDTLYGGTPAARVYLHAAELALQHPENGELMRFGAAANFERDPRLELRSALIETELTDAFRLIHGASDGWPRWYVERVGEHLLSQGEKDLSPAQRAELERVILALHASGASHKLLRKQVGQSPVAGASPQAVLGQPPPERFAIRENGLQFDVSFQEGYSVGLFFDQRDNRRRLLTGHIAAGFSLLPERRAGPLSVLNTFAYTCGFSVCAAQAGVRTTSLDLSKKYLEWGRRNFALNRIDPAAHDFIYGDVFDWLPRLRKKQRWFDLILLDPPTFSQSKQSGAFLVEKDYGKLVAAALPLLKPGGVLFASANAATWPAEKFLQTIETPVRNAKREIVQSHYVPQPPDFPVSPSEPAYLKTVWMRLA
jgi:23S rRNA (cytosine1962-C5)-methyltransferase